MPSASFLFAFITLIVSVHAEAQGDPLFAPAPTGSPEIESELIVWKPGTVQNWRKWFVHIGQYGELIGGPDYNIGADILYTIPTQRGFELHHSGPTWEGMFALVDREGVIHVSEVAQGSDVPLPPRAIYGPWPKSADGSLRPLAKDEIIFPKEDGDTVRVMKRPFKETGWVILLVAGELYFPDQTIQPSANVLWIVRGKRGIKLIQRDAERKEVWATVDSNLVVSSAKDSRWNLARWTYVDEQQRPIIPPAGTILTPGEPDAKLITVDRNGRLFIPGTAIP